MSMERINHAAASGGLSLPEGKIALFGALAADGLGDLPASQTDVIQTFYPEFTTWQKRITTRTAPKGSYATAIVTLPRAKALSQDLIARACQAAPHGLVLVNGAKTHGIDSILKALKPRVTLLGQVSKAHGKCLWFNSTDALADWALPEMSKNPEGDFTAPGVFSADGADPASRLLARALPETLKGQFADLGAGWGWLSRELLKRPAVSQLHLVEAELSALNCAEANIKDERAVFHWHDALTWALKAGSPSKPMLGLDGIVMNPPFHTGRKGEPSLGQDFISAAARLLASHGQLWMVANRHLPYETTLEQKFRDVTEIAGTSKFKVLHAARPSRAKR